MTDKDGKGPVGEASAGADGFGRDVIIVISSISSYNGMSDGQKYKVMFVTIFQRRSWQIFYRTRSIFSSACCQRTLQSLKVGTATYRVAINIHVAVCPAAYY